MIYMFFLVDFCELLKLLYNFDSPVQSLGFRLRADGAGACAGRVQWRPIATNRQRCHGSRSSSVE